MDKGYNQKLPKSTSLDSPQNYELRKSGKISSFEHKVEMSETSTVDSASLMKREASITEDIVKGLESITELTNQHLAKKQELDAQLEADKLHTLRYSSGVLNHKPAQARNVIEDTATTKESPSSVNKSNATVEMPFIDEEDEESSPLVLTATATKTSEKNPGDAELSEAIRKATGLGEEQVVASIQLAETDSSSTSASTLLVSQRSCSGTDTIHMSEKVIQRDYKDV